jgi:hypothetical protein
MENISVVATGTVALKEKKNAKTGAVTKAPFMGTSYGAPVFTGIQLRVEDTIIKADGTEARVWITNLFVKTKDLTVANHLSNLDGEQATLKGWIQTENLASDKDAPANFVSFFYVDAIASDEEATY